MRERIFLSGTEEVDELMQKLIPFLNKLEYKPIWYKEEFSVQSGDAIKDCLTNLKNADKFILIIGKRYGTIHKRTGISLIEEEYKRAYETGKPIMVFVESEIYYKSKIYKGLKNIDPDCLEKNYENLNFKAKRETFELISKINVNNSWISHYSDIEDIKQEISRKFSESSIKYEIFRDEIIHISEIEVLKELESQVEPEFKSGGDTIEIDENLVFSVENKHITGIGIYNMKIETLPKSINELKNLWRLEIYNTKLSKLPNSLGELNLIILDLSNNELTDLPESLKNIKYLDYVYLSGNPFLDYPSYDLMKTLLEIKHNSANIDIDIKVAQ
ncbi:MAG: DUF4062 domain-containing protein [Promethearchaeia archaeon]